MNTGAADRRAIVVSHLVMIGLVLGMGLLSIAFAERIPLSEGLGWDGSFFGAMARDFHRMVFVDGVDPYRLQRALPSGIVHYGLRLAGAPLDNPHVVLGFAFLDLALLVFAAALWMLVADRLQLGLRARWLGFTGLFVNYAILKHAFYIPVMSDVSAFTLGLLMFYLFLADRPGWLLAVTVLGAFTWPVAVPIGAALLLVPVRSVAPPASQRSVLATAIAAALAAACVSAFVYMYFVRHLRKVGMGPTIPVVAALVVPSMVLYGLHIFVAFRALGNGMDGAYLGRTIRQLRPRRIALAFLALVLPKLLSLLLPQGQAQTLDLRGFARYLVFLPNARPYVFMLAHIVWFGPVLILALLFWRSICRAIGELGPGLAAAVAIGLIIALTPESRQSSMSLPMVVALVARVSDGRRWSLAAYWLLAATALAMSKFWLRINSADTFAGAASGRVLTDAETARQYRNYFLSNGPWMTNTEYAVQLAVVLAVGLSLYVVLRGGEAVSTNAMATQPVTVARSESIA